MGKIFTIIALMMLLGSIYAQDVSKTFTFDRKKTVLGRGTANDVAVATDTLGTVDQDTVDYIFYANKDYPLQYYFWTNLDSTTGTPAVSIVLAGRVFDTESWTNITTVNWAGSSSDTSFSITAISKQTYTIAAYDAVFDARIATITAFDVPFMNPTAGTVDTLEFPEQTVTFAADTLEVPAQTITYTDITQYYRQLRMRYIITSGTATIDHLYPKLYERQY